MQSTLGMKFRVLIICSIAFAHYHAARVMIYPVVTVIGKEFQTTYTHLGIVISGYEIGYGLTLILGGYLADRYNRKYLITFGLIWLSITNFLTTFALTPMQLTVIRIITGMSFGTYFAAGLSLISEYFPEKERGRAIGIHGMIAGIGRFVTIPITGLMIGRMGWHSPFILLSFFSLAASVLFYLMGREPRIRADQPVKTEKEEAEKKGLLHFLKFFTPMIIIVTVLYSLIIACCVMEGAFMLLYMTDIHKFSVQRAANLLGLSQITDVFSTPIATALSDRFGRKVVLNILLLLSAISYLLFIIVKPGIWMVLIIIFGIGLVFTSAMVLQVIMIDMALPKMRGITVGLMNTSGVIFAFIASPAMGYIADRFGLRFVFIVMILVVFSAIVLTKKLRAYP